MIKQNSFYERVYSFYGNFLILLRRFFIIPTFLESKSFGRTARGRLIIISLCFIFPISIVTISLISSLLTHSFEVQRKVRIAQASTANILRLQIDEEISLREYLDAGSPTSLNPYLLASSQFEDSLFVLESQLRALDLPKSWWLVENIRNTHSFWVSTIANKVLASPLKVEYDRNKIFVKNETESIRSDGYSLSSILERRANASDAETVTRFFQIIGFCVTSILITLFGILWLSRRQERLKEALREANITVDAFQRAALPTGFPEVAGLSFDGVYVPAIAKSRIGGDWYDAFQMPDGRIVISIGDVSGFGLHAAITMAAVRQYIRAAAEMNPDPVMIIDAADRTLKIQQPDRIVTAFVCVYDPIARSLSYCSAGHPPPILRDSTGFVTQLEQPGLPLGLRARSDETVLYADVDPGSFFVFYTDGLIEASRDVIGSFTELMRLAGSSEIFQSAHPALAIHKSMLPGGTMDDVAVLTLRIDAIVSSRSWQWSCDSSDGEHASIIRHEFIEVLNRSGVCSDDLFTAELVFGEMLGNIVRYAPGIVDIILDWGGFSPVLHFIDNGPGFVLNPRLPSDTMSEQGRGLFLVWSLTEEFNVSRSRYFGSHARAVLIARKRIIPRVNIKSKDLVSV